MPAEESRFDGNTGGRAGDAVFAQLSARFGSEGKRHIGNGNGNALRCECQAIRQRRPLVPRLHEVGDGRERVVRFLWVSNLTVPVCIVDDVKLVRL